MTEQQLLATELEYDPDFFGNEAWFVLGLPNYLGIYYEIIQGRAAMFIRNYPAHAYVRIEFHHKNWRKIAMKFINRWIIKAYVTKPRVRRFLSFGEYRKQMFPKEL